MKPGLGSMDGQLARAVKQGKLTEYSLNATRDGWEALWLTLQILALLREEV